MTDLESLKHTRWECKYQIVFIPKGRKKRIYSQLRTELGLVFKELVQHRESKVEEGHLMTDHVHMLVSIPPKYSGMGTDDGNCLKALAEPRVRCFFEWSKSKIGGRFFNLRPESDTLE
jgi:REP element-mobilizing transposase RayT